MVIQALLLLSVAVLLVVFIRSRHGVRLQASKRIAFILFLVANAYAVLRPNDLTWVAHRVGVGRGADLVLYALVAAFTFTVVNFYLRERELKQRITQLARAVALREAEIVNRDRGLFPQSLLLTNAVSDEPVANSGAELHEANLH